ncbi:DUF2333 family protein [Aurantivibrio plasticivorans]
MKKLWISVRRMFSDNVAELSEDAEMARGWLKYVFILVAVIVLIQIGVGIYWSSEPDQFEIDSVTRELVNKYGHQPVTGSATTAALITVADTLLEKPGGFLSNDILPPGVWLDNMPNWEYGALIQVRDLSKAMRESFSRSQSQSLEDSDLAIAESRFNFDNESWALPPSESEYKEGIRYLEGYLQRLGDEDQTNAQYFSRADNLRYWLSTVETRLGNLSQRLSASVGQRRINTDLAGAPGAMRSTDVPSEQIVQTPWTEIDDVFYEARGSAWALLHFLRAVQVDFGDVLEKKNASVSLDQIIRELEGTQDPIFSPMILNGGGFGFLANHSLVMASYISRANAAIIDLRDLLSQG